MKTNKLFLLLFLFVFALSNVAPAMASSRDRVTDLSMEDEKISFSIDIPIDSLKIERINVAGKEYSSLVLADYSSNAEAGMPMLPSLSRSLGIPFGASYDLRVVGVSPTVVLLEAPVLPKPFQKFSDELDLSISPADPPAYTFEFSEDVSVYQQNVFFPSDLGVVANDGIMRSQRILTLRLNPVQYNPSTSELLVYERLDVEVTITGNSQIQSSDPMLDSDGYEESLAANLLNYEQARAWRSDQVKVENLPAEINSQSMTGQWTPPANAWRIQILQEGLYQLTYGELSNAGMNMSSLDPRKLQLWYRGQEVAIKVVGETDGVFDPNDQLLFYAEAIETNKYTQFNTYWLIIGNTNGSRMTTRSVTPGSGQSVQDHAYSFMIEDNKSYFSRYRGSDDLERFVGDQFFGSVAKGTGATTVGRWTRSFNLVDVSDGSGELDITLLGYSDSAALSPHHHVTVWLNGVRVGDVSWDGFGFPGKATLAIPPGMFLTGTNTLELLVPMDNQRNPADFSVDKYDRIIFDKIEITARSQFTATGPSFSFTAEADGLRHISITGLTATSAVSFDTTNPFTPVELLDFSVLGSNLVFNDNFAGKQKYWFGDPTTFRAVASIIKDEPSGLSNSTNQADWIIISHQAFLTQAQTLANWRQSNGLNAKVVNLRDVYDEFGYGIESAYAIREFLAYTYQNWVKPAPTYVVLMGDGHYDLKGYMRTNRQSFVPPFLLNVDPFWIENSSDNNYVLLEGDDHLPEMMIGRLSVNTAAEAQAVVTKIINYESDRSNADWKRVVTDVADKTGPAGNFPAMSFMLIHDELPEAYHDVNTSIYHQITHPDLAATRAAILSSLNQGTVIFNYIGHSSQIQYGDENLFRTDNLPSLTNANMPSINVIMSCLEGYFIDPRRAGTTNYVDSMAEQGVRFPNAGPVAIWSSAGMAVASGHDHLNRGFFHGVFSNRVETIGQAVNAGLFRLWEFGRFQDLLEIYHLFGDPATRIQRTLLARPDFFVMKMNESLDFSIGGLIENDDNPPDLPLTVSMEVTPSFGVLSDLGGGNMRYTPDAGFVGLDSFEYSLFDGSVRSNTTTVYIRVRLVDLFLPVVLTQ